LNDLASMARSFGDLALGVSSTKRQQARGKGKATVYFKVQKRTEAALCSSLLIACENSLTPEQKQFYFTCCFNMVWDCFFKIIVVILSCFLQLC